MYEIKTRGDVAVIESAEAVITDAQSALDLIATVYYEKQISKLAVSKAAIAGDFFRLSTGLAGEIAQKFTQYGVRLAIVGDFSGYTSGPLRDYMYECNKGGGPFFCAGMDEALEKLGR